MHDPRVSVIMCGLDAGAFLEAALDSVDRQAVDYEIIFVDDGSSDDTASIIADTKANVAVVIRHDRPLGVAASLNDAVEVARGEYLARFDADDLMLKGRLLKQARFLDEHPDVDVVSGGYRFIRSDGRRLPSAKLRRNAANAEVQAAFLLGNPIVHPTVMFRRTALDRAPYPVGQTFEDYALWLSTPTWRWTVLKTRFVEWRLHSANASQRGRREGHEELIPLLAIRWREAGHRIGEEAMRAILSPGEASPTVLRETAPLIRQLVVDFSSRRSHETSGLLSHMSLQWVWRAAAAVYVHEGLRGALQMLGLVATVRDAPTLICIASRTILRRALVRS